jgi:hypothetical protein
MNGIAAIDDCVGQGGCNANGCPTNCSPNFWYAAWPNFTECNGNVCGDQPGVPAAGGCNATMWFSSPCVGFNDGATVWECGPVAFNSNAGACNDGTTLPVIACITSSLFADLCNGCCPLLWGLVRVTAPSI